MKKQENVNVYCPSLNTKENSSSGAVDETTPERNNDSLYNPKVAGSHRDINFQPHSPWIRELNDQTKLDAIDHLEEMLNDAKSELAPFSELEK